MTLSITELASRIDAAAQRAEAIEQFSAAGELSVAEAYQIQKASIENRRQRGEALCGAKMGFTSRVKMQQMGVSDLIIGRLTDAMQIPDGGSLDLANFVYPSVEPEIAFCLRHSLSGKINLIEAMNAIDALAPAMEIADSRYRDFKFSLPDAVADNCSASAFVVGGWARPDTNIDNLGLGLFFNGRPVATGSTAAILGRPLQALVEAARLAEENEVDLNAGDIVLAGAATAAIPLQPGSVVQAEFQRIGRLGFRVKGARD